MRFGARLSVRLRLGAPPQIFGKVVQIAVELLLALLGHALDFGLAATRWQPP
jgi:hypothetical protein